MSERKSIDERFAEFHAANPGVYQELLRLARAARAAGRQRVGIKMLVEVVRWHHFLVGRDEDGYKLNNSYSSRYARLLMEREPDLADLFETREIGETRLEPDVEPGPDARQLGLTLQGGV